MQHTTPRRQFSEQARVGRCHISGVYRRDSISIERESLLSPILKRMRFNSSDTKMRFKENASSMDSISWSAELEGKLFFSETVLSQNVGQRPLYSTSHPQILRPFPAEMAAIFHRGSRLEGPSWIQENDNLDRRPESPFNGAHDSHLPYFFTRESKGRRRECLCRKEKQKISWDFPLSSL